MLFRESVFIRRVSMLHYSKFSFNDLDNIALLETYVHGIVQTKKCDLLFNTMSVIIYQFII